MYFWELVGRLTWWLSQHGLSGSDFKKKKNMFVTVWCRLHTSPFTLSSICQLSSEQFWLWILMSNLYKKANRRYNETWSAYIFCVTFAWISSIDCAVYLWPGLSLPYCLLYYVYDELKANGDMCSEGETIEKSTSIAFICVSMAVTIRRTCSLAAHGSVCVWASRRGSACESECASRVLD